MALQADGFGRHVSAPHQPPIPDAVVGGANGGDVAGVVESGISGRRDAKARLLQGQPIQAARPPLLGTGPELGAEGARAASLSRRART